MKKHPQSQSREETKRLICDVIDVSMRETQRQDCGGFLSLCQPYKDGGQLIVLTTQRS